MTLWIIQICLAFMFIQDFATSSQYVFDASFRVWTHVERTTRYLKGISPKSQDFIMSMNVSVNGPNVLTKKKRYNGNIKHHIPLYNFTGEMPIIANKSSPNIVFRIHLHKRLRESASAKLNIYTNLRKIDDSRKWWFIIYGGQLKVYRIDKQFLKKVKVLIVLKVSCLSDGFGKDCKFCKPENSTKGHYNCNSNGDKICHTGWINPEDNCKQRTCVEGDCRNGGTCSIDESNDIICTCTKYNFGSRCEKFHKPCDLFKCKHGECINFNKTHRNCKCPREWIGNECGIRRKPCNLYPCYNKASCKEIDDKRRTCKCPELWTGDSCRYPVLPCEIWKCHNDGKCVNIDRFNYECICHQNWTGAKCDVEAVRCENIDCLNKGKCMKDSRNVLTCRCQRGYTGERCEKDVDECEDETACGNFSTCRNNYGGYNCTCISPAEGKFCELCTDGVIKRGRCFTKPPTVGYGTMELLLVIVLSAILMYLSLLWFVKKLRTDAQRS